MTNRIIGSRLALLLWVTKAPRQSLETYAKKLDITIGGVSRVAKELRDAGILDCMREEGELKGRPRKLWYVRPEALGMVVGYGLTVEDLARLARILR